MTTEPRPVRIRSPERDAAGIPETPLSSDEVRVAIREGWTYSADVVERRRLGIINFEEQAA